MTDSIDWNEMARKGYIQTLCTSLCEELSICEEECPGSQTYSRHQVMLFAFVKQCQASNDVAYIRDTLQQYSKLHYLDL